MKKGHLLGFRPLYYNVFFLLGLFLSLLLTTSSGFSATFNQTNWGQGAPTNATDCSNAGGSWSGTVCFASSPGDETGWSLYGSKDSEIAVVNVGADLELAAPARAYIHDKNEDFALNYNTSITQSGVEGFAGGSGDVRVAELVALSPLSFSAAWVDNEAWNLNDAGANGIPVFADLDDDGLIDVMIGNSLGGARVYRNTGTNAVPDWTYFPSWNGPDIANSYGAPTLGDLDNDGDLDLLIGRQDGTAYGFRNTAGKTSPSWERVTEWTTADVGGIGRATPRLVDIDGDEDLDLFQGSQSGVVYGYENTNGTASPVWEPKAEWNADIPGFGGYSVPEFGDLDVDGDLDLLIGDSNGNVWAYRNIKLPEATDPVWERYPDWDTTVTTYSFAAPALFDFDDDGDLDLAIGHSGGASQGRENVGTQYPASGTFVSPVIDAGLHQGLTTINFSAQLPAGTSIVLDVHSGNVDTPDASWTTWQTGVVDGGDISLQGFNRYVQYRAHLSTTDQYFSPKLSAVTLTYLQYPHAADAEVDIDKIRLAVTSATQVWTEDAWDPPSVGTRSKPRFVDMNGDGVVDLMIGERFGDILGLENIGSNDAPVWERRSEWDITGALTSWGGAGYADLDNDGDYDAIIANGNGETFGYRNKGTKFVPDWEPFPDWDLGNIGFNISPDLGDFDADGDYDLIVGGYFGIGVYENTGTKSEPEWTGNGDWAFSSGNDSSPAVADLDGDGDLDLMVGRDNGDTYGYENIGSKFLPDWVRQSAWDILTDTPYANKRASPTLARIGPDWDYDLIIGEDTGVNFAYTNTGVRNHALTGTYLSSPIDLEQYEALTTLDYMVSLPIGTSMKVDMRTGSTPYPGDENWTGWLEDISNGGDISTLPPHRYAQYRLTLETTDTTITPFLDSITINYQGYAASASLISSPFNTVQAGTLIRSLAWNESLFDNTSIRVQMRVARDNAGAPGTWTEWMGPDGSSLSFWNSSNLYDGQCSGGGTVICDKVPAKLRNGINAQWFQYKVTLTSDGISTPTLAEIDVEFNIATTGGSGGFTVSALSNNTSEDEATATFTVVLNAAPTADVFVGVYSDDTSESFVSPQSLLFTAENWDQARTITVTGMDDVFDDGDIAHSIILGAAVSADANYDDRNPSDVSITNVDNDVSGFVFNPNSGLVTNESGQTANLGVSLSTQPSDSVTISFSSSVPTEGNITSTDTLVFTPENWSVEQSIVITGQDDAVIDGNVDYWIETGVVLSGDDGYSGLNPPDVSASNADNDRPDILVHAPWGLVTSEWGGFTPISVSLATAPTHNVTLEFVVDFFAPEGYVDPFSAVMVFTPDDWDTPQSTTITGKNDGIVDGDQEYTIETRNFTSDDANYGGTKPSDITLINLDDDSHTISLSATSDLVTSEDGGSVTFYVHLGARPAEDVTINVTSSDPSEGVPLTESITFSASGESWRGLPVTIVGVDDREMDYDKPYTVAFEVVTDDANYTGATLPDVSLTNLDNNRSAAQHLQNDIASSRFGYKVAHADVNCDTIPDLLISTQALTYDEVYAFYGSTGGYGSTPHWVARDTVAHSDFGAGLASVGDVDGNGCDDIMIGAPSYSASKGAAYLFLGSADGLPDGGDGVAGPDDAAWKVFGDYNDSNVGDNFTAGDFDGNGFIDVVVSARAYDNGESNEGRVHVFLNFAGELPDIDSDDIALLSEASWMFESDIDNGYAGQHQGLASANVNGDAWDDLLIGVGRDNTGGTVAEGRVYAFYGSGALFNDDGDDGLAKPGDADWVVESDNYGAYLSSVANAGDLNGDGVDDIIVGAYHYENGETNEGGAYVFFGNDPNGLPDTGGDKIAHPEDASWQVESNDDWARFGHWVSPAGDFNNDGYQDVMAGAVNYSPDTDRIGALFVYPGGEGGLSTTPEWIKLGRDAGDWYGHVAGTLGDIDGDGYSDIYVGAHGYGTYTTGVEDKVDEGAVFVFISNVQTPGFTVTPLTGLQTTESGGEALFSVVLDAPPRSDVTISVSTDDPAESEVLSTALVFNISNWDKAQSVVVRGKNDTDVDDDVSYQVSFAVTATADSDFAVLPATNFGLVNLDNEVMPQISVTASGGDESVDGSLTFSHTGEISNPLSVAYSVAGTATPGLDYQTLSGEVTIPAGSFSYTVPVLITSDVIVESDETIVVTVEPSLDYDIGSPASATLNILNDDVAGVVVSPSFGLVTTETSGVEYVGVRLTSQPEQSVTIEFSSGTPLEASVLPVSLEFTEDNWSTEQFVTVVGVNDSDVDSDQPFTIITSNAISLDDNYSGLVVADITGTNRDDDVLPTVSITTDTATIAEGETLTNAFSFTRTGATTAELDVLYSMSGSATWGDDYTRYTGSLTIPTGAASVSLSLDAIQDTLAEGDETIVLTLQPSSSYLVGLPANNSITIIDDELSESLPQVNFALDQAVGEGQSVTVEAFLNKPASTYPVTVPFSLSGTAENSVDYEIFAGSIDISAGLSGSVSLNVIDDSDPGESDELVIFQMGQPTNAQPGYRLQHTVRITEYNLPPQVSLVSEQGGVDARLIVTSGGDVTVTATVDDPNPGDTHTYDWSLTNNSLFALDIDDADPATLVFNPTGLAAGFYKVRLEVADSGSPAEIVNLELLLELVTTAPTLTAADSDGDGIADNAESFDDSDGDGVMDYLDSNTLAANELQISVDDSTSYIMRTELGLKLALGDVAFAAGADGAHVSSADILAYGGGEGAPGSVAIEDTVVSPSGYFDFVVSELPEAGQSIKVVIPQLTAIPPSAAYRKYDPDLGWRDFTEDLNNKLESAPGVPGHCPLPGDDNYRAGLNQGDYCIQLTIEDGGANDADGEINNVVEDPGSMIEDTSEQQDLSTQSQSSSSSGGGGGAWNFGLVFLLFLMMRALWQHAYSHRKIAR